MVQLQIFLIYVNKHSHDLTLGLEPPRIRVIVANGYVSWLGIIKQTGIKACFAALIGTAYVDYVTMSYATNIILQAKRYIDLFCNQHDHNHITFICNS